MYTYTPTAKFLVLAPIQSAPPPVTTSRFLVLSPIHSAPHRNEDAEGSISSHVRERSDSESSTTSRSVCRLPGGFLFLGHEYPSVSEQTETESNVSSQTRERSGSLSSTSSSRSGFLFLGHEHPRTASLRF
ncbi:hypothetical protein BJX76DRAFT_354194 [Aspergillus varians]